MPPVNTTEINATYVAMMNEVAGKGMLAHAVVQAFLCEPNTPAHEMAAKVATEAAVAAFTHGLTAEVPSPDGDARKYVIPVPGTAFLLVAFQGGWGYTEYRAEHPDYGNALLDCK